MLWQRVLFGAVMIAALVGLVWLDERIAQSVADDWTPRLLINLGLYFHEGFVLTLVVVVLVVLANRELGRLLRAGGAEPAVGWAAVASVGLVFIPWLVRNGLTANVSADPMTDSHYTMTWLVVSVFGAALAAAARRRTAGAVAALTATLLAIVYLGFLASFVVRLRMWGGSAWLVLYFLFVCKVCDIGAYFTGLAVGRHRLIAWLSPNKTWEGLAGGIIASTALAALLAWLGAAHGPASLRFALPDLRQALIFGAVMAVVGQAGDLLESLLKRDAGAKDSGAVVPAFGGVLDIVDSPLLAAPVACWMLLK